MIESHNYYHDKLISVFLYNKITNSTHIYNFRCIIIIIMYIDFLYIFKRVDLLNIQIFKHQPLIMNDIYNYKYVLQ